MRENAFLQGGFADDLSFENHHSWRANFALWAITSSPLILSFDLTDQNKTAKVRAKTGLFVHVLIYKTIISPRQARDKRRESRKRLVFCRCGTSLRTAGSWKSMLLGLARPGS